MVGVRHCIWVRYGSHASRKLKVPEKIPVQLLKNVESIGVKGEVINVRPAFMRNFLHVDNKATYILKGEKPPLPVVIKAANPIQPKVEKHEVKIDTTKVKQTTSAISLDELSSLFQKMSKKSGQKVVSTSFVQDEPASENIYSISELKQAIPSVYTIQTSKSKPLPLDVNHISDILFDLSGINVPNSAIQVSLGKTIVKSIEKIGTYNLIISSPTEKTSLNMSLIVK